jgi:serine/threonine-protein kinase
MAKVHLGRLVGEAGFSRVVAIKRLHEQFASEPEFVATLLDEARLASRIQHPNVVPTLDVVVDGSEVLMVLEYVAGESFGRLLRASVSSGNPVPYRLVTHVIAGVLHGLHAAHEALAEDGSPLHIVHRDVSPQNILVGVDGLARVLDFGIAKARVRLQSTGAGQLKGKLAYMAPEQLGARGAVTSAVDIYAASVVLWEGLAGRRAFESDDEGGLIGRVLAGVSDPPSAFAPGVPPELDAIVMRGLDRDPARRFASARELAILLEERIGTATARQVGDWVKTVAAEPLAKRALMVAEIERAKSPEADASRKVLDLAERRKKDARRIAPALASRDATVSEVVPAPPAADSTQLGAMTSVHVRRPRVGLALTVLMLAFVAVAAVVIVRNRSVEKVSVAPVVSESPVPQREPLIQTPSAEPVPSASISPPPSAKPARVLAKPVSPTKRSKSDPCTVKSVVGPDGIERLKPECL